MFYATKPLKCILSVFVVLVLFQFYSKTTLCSQSHFQKHCKSIYVTVFHGKPFIGLQISSNFREMMRLCTFKMPFLYDLDFIFLSV